MVMTKQNILNLIKHHVDENDSAFRTEAYEIARRLDEKGEPQLSEYIMSLLSGVNTFVPMSVKTSELQYLQKAESRTSNSLHLPKPIMDDVMGIVNAITHDAGVNKFLFEGAPGTGKTESVKHIARILERSLFIVNFDTIIDSKLGQSVKNLSDLFNEIAIVSRIEKAIFLFDEIDAIAIDRINSNDVREMGRTTSAMLKHLDNLNNSSVIIATTNLMRSFDKALVRRFDAIINFDKYSNEDLVEVAVEMTNGFLLKYKNASKNTKLLVKILTNSKLPYPGELCNLIKASIAFSDPLKEFDYIRRIYESLNPGLSKTDIRDFKKNGYTVREIEILTETPKSSASRLLKEDSK